MKKEIMKCSVCSNENLEIVLELPNLPLTGIYINADEEDNYPLFDQALMVCNECGHIQLKYMIDPEYMYQDTYTHKSGQSPISKAGNDFFINYLKEVLDISSIESIYEIGCNDLYLLLQLKSFAGELVGVDPVWGDRKIKQENISVIGGFAEGVDISKAFDRKPNLVISSHTFEHIQDVHSVLEHTISNTKDGTQFVIEIPSSDTMFKICRFDQVFHQHFNYFSLHSFFNFIQLHDCEFLDYTMNYDYWGGTMLMYFQKGGKTNKKNPFKKYTKKDILQRYELFKNDLNNIERIIIDMNEDIYGFGAAQMLPILSYHMDSSLSFLKGIIDDNPERCNKKLVGLDVPIINSKKVDNLDASVIVLTALDSSKAILDRLINDIKPRYIIKPIQIM